MKNRIAFALNGVVVSLVLASNAGAACPAQPLAALSGTWAFSTDGFTIPAFRFLGSGGRFTAAPGADKNGNPIGVLNISETASIDGSIARFESAQGRYQLNDDCTGGTLTFYTGSRPVQFDFFFVNSGEMVVVGSANGDVVRGTARLVAGVTCPNVSSGAIAGTWVFSLEGFDLVRGFPEVASAGRFVAAGNVVDVTQTAGVFGGNVRYETDRGTIQVAGGCSNGSMTFSVAGRPIQLDFFFADANRIVLAGSLGGDIITGEARRFGS